MATGMWCPFAVRHVVLLVIVVSNHWPLEAQTGWDLSADLPTLAARAGAERELHGSCWRQSETRGEDSGRWAETAETQDWTQRVDYLLALREETAAGLTPRTSEEQGVEALMVKETAADLNWSDFLWRDLNEVEARSWNNPARPDLRSLLPHWGKAKLL